MFMQKDVGHLNFKAIWEDITKLKIPANTGEKIIVIRQTVTCTVIEMAIDEHKYDQLN